MSKLNIGDYNTLTVVKVALREGNGDPFGLYLDGGREGEILMPEKYVPEGTAIGDELRVFVYLDQEERPRSHWRWWETSLISNVRGSMNTGHF